MTLLKSWVDSANSATTEFPLNNLPYGVFSIAGDAPRCGVAIGDQILDVAALERKGQLSIGYSPILQEACWNPLMELGAKNWRAFRTELISYLREGAPDQDKTIPHLYPMADACMHMPFRVSEFTDFYAGRYHATNVGTMFRGAENALPPNWLHIPIGYNGRASSVVVATPLGTAERSGSGTTRFPAFATLRP